MLQKNRLQPPRDYAPDAMSIPGRLAGFESQGNQLFVSAEDFDCTGILAGVDPCESNYWWIPEMYSSTVVRAESFSPLHGISAGILEAMLQNPPHAVRRTASRTTAAA